MPWSMSNVPSFAKNKSKEEQEIAVNAANSVLAKGGSEEDSIFAAIAALKMQSRRESQKKAAEAPKRVVPSHLLAVLEKAIVEPPSPVVEDNNRLPISREFLGKNALPVGQDRNLVSVELKDNLKLYHTFDTGEQIITDLSKVQGTIENYVSLSTSGSSVNSKSMSVDTFADVALIVTHDLNLQDPEAIMISAYLNGKLVDLDIQILDSNSIEVLTYVDTVGLKLNFLGL